MDNFHRQRVKPLTRDDFLEQRDLLKLTGEVMKKRNITVSGQEGGYEALKHQAPQAPEQENAQIGASEIVEKAEESLEERLDDTLINEENVIEELAKSDEEANDKPPVVEEASVDAVTEEDFPIKSDYAKKKIDKLTAQNKARAEEISLLKERLEKTSAQQAVGGQNFFTDPLTGQQYMQPTAEKYGANTPQYLEDMMKYQQAKKMAEQMVYQQQELAVEKNQIFATYQSKVEQAKQKYKDYGEVVEKNPVISALDNAHPDISTQIMESEYATDIAYYLGKNRELVRELIKQPASKVAKEIGRLEGIIEMTTKPKVISKAPAPSLTSQNSGARTGKSPSSKDYSAYSASEWREKVKERMKRGR